MKNEKSQAMKLFWVTTPAKDHESDWFVLAYTKSEAAKYLEEYDGYEFGDAVAEFVLAVPETVHVLGTGNGHAISFPAWASADDLTALGLVDLSTPDHCIFKLGDRTFGRDI